MHFVLEGRVGVIVDLGEGRTVRVRSLGRHTTIGEMGLITGRPRRRDPGRNESVLYELRADDYHPDQGAASGAGPGPARLRHRRDGRAAERQPRDRVRGASACCAGRYNFAGRRRQEDVMRRIRC